VSPLLPKFLVCMKANELEILGGQSVTPGRLKGLLFGDPRRFITDLVLELKLKASFKDFVAAASKQEGLERAFRSFVEAAGSYQRRTGYQCLWDWPKLDSSLETLKSPKIEAILAKKKSIREASHSQVGPFPGGPYHNRYNDGLMYLEDSTPRLIAAMQETLLQM
jgi:hypothetical protein